MGVNARISDSDLLLQYKRGSEEAFAELVRRHIDWVYSAALRRAGRHELAEDITQSVFIVLAKESPRLRPGTPVGPWLFGVLRHAASNALRAERRRKSHEQFAAMNTQTQTELSESWQRIAPHLEQAVARLRESDRHAIVLRFYEQKEFEEVATVLGLSEMAARKRVQRAVERLRQRLGESQSAQTLGGVLSAHIAHSAGVGLASATTQIALAAAHGAAPISAATVLANAVKQAIARTKLLWLTGGAVTVILLLTMLTWFSIGYWNSSHSMDAAAPIATSSTVSPVILPSTAPIRPIKVGVLVSQYTATGPCWTTNRKQFGYLRARQAIILLKDPQIDLFAIVDPGTDLHGEIAGAIRGMPPDHVLDGGNAVALRNLDVIVSYFQWNLRDEVLAAMVQAVRNGTGLLVQGGAGIYRPGFTENVQKLEGLTDAFEIYRGSETACTVLPGHPLTDPDVMPNRSFTIPTFTGAAGKLRGTPLMQADLTDADFTEILWQNYSRPTTQIVSAPTTQPATRPTVEFFPLYVSQLGKGRIVVCQWESMPADWREATKSRFHIHAVQWLAHREIQ